MPAFVDPNGLIRYVPGVYGKQDVVSSLAGAVGAFFVPILAAGADEGYPYNGDDGIYSEESAQGPFRYAGSEAAVGSYYGPDGDLAVAMKFAKRHGLPFAWTVCLSALTRASIPVQSAGPVVQYTLYPRKFGAPGNHAKVKIVGGNSITVTPVKYRSLCTANVAIGATRVYVKDNSWVRVGQTVYLGDNNSDDTAFVVAAVGSEPSATGQLRAYVDFTTATAAAYTTALYGMLVEWDDTHPEVSGVLADTQAQIDWFNTTSKVFGAHKEAATFTNPATVTALATSTPLKEVAVWGAVVKGTSPAPTSSDHSTLITLLDATAYDLFTQAHGAAPRTWCVIDSGSTAHASWRDWAIAKRTAGDPVSVVVGCAWGDTDLSASNDTNPVHRATALNSQDLQLCAGGIDFLGAYITLAPIVWALRVAGGLGHNLTNDPIIYSELEHVWDERNSGELTALCKGGVVSYRLSIQPATAFFVITEGLSTLQNNANAWNVDTGDTPLVMQRDIVDFCDVDMQAGLTATQTGADHVTRDGIAAYMRTRSNLVYVKRGYLQADGFRIVGIVLDDTGAGWNVEWAIKPPNTTDFIGLLTHVLVGD